jgi:hypothetical protein
MRFVRYIIKLWNSERGTGLAGTLVQYKEQRR